MDVIADQLKSLCRFVAKHRHGLMILLFALVFLLGDLMILNPGAWTLGMYEDVRTVGTFTAVLGGVGLLLELYCKR